MRLNYKSDMTFNFMFQAVQNYAMTFKLTNSHLKFALTLFALKSFYECANLCFYSFGEEENKNIINLISHCFIYLRNMPKS